MADKHGLNYDVRELKLGTSFTNNKSSQYHTIKYDFKPASVDVSKMATVDVGTNNQVTVTVPHMDGKGVPQTVFKGSQRPYTKECVLIIDRVTGEITLEKLSSNVQVKKTRQESAAKPRPLTPLPPPGAVGAMGAVLELQNTTQRSSSRTRVATTRRTPAPLPATPAGPAGSAAAGAARYPAGGLGAGPGAGAGAGKGGGMMRSPPRQRTSPPQAAPWSGGGNSTLASLPMIGLDDAPAPPPHARPERAERQERPERRPAPPPPAPPAAPSLPPPSPPPRSPLPPLPPLGAAPVSRPAPQLPPAPSLGGVESSSSSSSDSGSDSDSDSDSDRPRRPPQAAHAGAGGNPALPSDVLNDDLCLSESGSDSD